ncbi:sensor histidine kinase [Nocardia sp. CDC160]|uniref:sensor histidine kinase n=1 Tax=Nocardia sp. CDC160 TaxID=3112166 RepID=UPI002DB9E7AD|nr:HAMP domain-containing sensor histidine kinase [Nocardia sp. CDC160]MEC3918969.1 HAMP domain-containing sensor histidine kinase [Nocardia sp. CDC160]
MHSNPLTEMESTPVADPAVASDAPERESVESTSARRRWSLRARLLVGQVVLLVVVVVGIGITTELALQQFLVHQVDVSLAETAKRALVDSGGGPSLGPRPLDQHSQPGPPPPSEPDYGPGPDFLNRRNIQPDTVGALVGTDKSVSAARVRGDGTQSVLSAAAREQLASVATGHPVSLDIPGEGHYRVEAATTWSGQTVITGLPLASVDAILMRVFLILLIVTASVLAIAITVGIWLIRSALAPLDRVAATAARVADLRLDRGEVTLPVRVPAADADQRTEVGQLGAAINRMLDHIAGALSARHESETRVRRFLADASHELRTPLSAIRGYAELAQRERDTSPEVVAHALSRVDSESRRMTTLVEDMLLLARLDAGRGLEQSPVDLTQLTVDAVADAHVAGPGLSWKLELPPEPIVITGDSARLHQVLANLLANARTHTGPGTTVTTALTDDGRGGACWHVTDNGPGIPADLQPEVFERFARGDSSRSRRAGSTGLGLAIVAAVVKAHGGDISVESSPGRTEFTVHLPATH